MSFPARHLRGGSVKFGRSKIEKASKPYEQSAYYLWWKFLQLSQKYKECCENEGKGELSEMYKDFGDIYATDFKTWWKTGNRGINLFGEELMDKIRVVKNAEGLNLNEGILTINIPIDLPKTFIIDELNKILDKAGKKSGKLQTPDINKVSTAKYQIVGKSTQQSLERSFAIYTNKQKNPSKSLWQCAIDAKCGFLKEPDSKMNKKLNDAEERRQKVNLQNIGTVYFNRAEMIIREVEEGKFPYFVGQKNTRHLVD
jgi:hypothetical protein